MTNLIVLTVSANEKVKREEPSNVDFSEYLNKFQEKLKPFIGGLPQLPNGGSLPFVGGSSEFGSSSEKTKRQAATPYSLSELSEWFSKLGENGNNPLTGNFQFTLPPSFGKLPFIGNGGGSSEETDNK